MLPSPTHISSWLRIFLLVLFANVTNFCFAFNLSTRVLRCRQFQVILISIWTGFILQVFANVASFSTYFNLALNLSQMVRQCRVNDSSLGGYSTVDTAWITSVGSVVICSVPLVWRLGIVRSPTGASNHVNPALRPIVCGNWTAPSPESATPTRWVGKAICDILLCQKSIDA